MENPITQPEKPERDAIICICRQAGQIQAEARRMEAHRLLGAPNPSCFADVLIMSLAFEFGAEVEVYSDQWFGLELKAGDFSDGIQADHPLDGLIELWFRLREAFPEKVTQQADENGSVARWSARQVERLKIADQELADHEANCPACLARKPKRCKDGHVLWLAGIREEKSMIDKWGSPDMDESPRFWGNRDAEPSGEAESIVKALAECEIPRVSENTDNLHRPDPAWYCLLCGDTECAAACPHRRAVAYYDKMRARTK